jgi:hypothetical protein
VNFNPHFPGLMVGTKPQNPPPPMDSGPSQENSVGQGGGGFGGGRRPDSSFEQVSLATLEDERNFFN